MEADYSSSRYSPGTSSSGTSCVRTSFSSAPSALSTPITASASNAFPSSINSSTLSESAPSRRDNPCRSPACSPERDRGPCGENAMTSARAILLRVFFLPEAFRITAFFEADFFFADVLRRLTVFIVVAFLRTVLFDLVNFFLVFFLVAIARSLAPEHTYGQAALGGKFAVTSLRNTHRSDEVSSDRPPRNCTSVVPVRGPPGFAARVDVDALPTNSPEISPDSDPRLRYPGKPPNGTHHRDVVCGHIDGSPPRTPSRVLQ